MFQNLSLRGFTWPREPILYLTLAGALLNVVIALLSGEIGSHAALESVLLLIGGFIGRAKVTPLSDARTNEGYPLLPAIRKVDSP